MHQPNNIERERERESMHQSITTLTLGKIHTQLTRERERERDHASTNHHLNTWRNSHTTYKRETTHQPIITVTLGTIQTQLTRERRVTSSWSSLILSMRSCRSSPMRPMSTIMWCRSSDARWRSSSLVSSLAGADFSRVAFSCLASCRHKFSFNWHDEPSCHKLASCSERKWLRYHNTGWSMSWLFSWQWQMFLDLFCTIGTANDQYFNMSCAILWPALCQITVNPFVTCRKLIC